MMYLYFNLKEKEKEKKNKEKQLFPDDPAHPIGVFKGRASTLQTHPPQTPGSKLGNSLLLLFSSATRSHYYCSVAYLSFALLGI